MIIMLLTAEAYREEILYLATRIIEECREETETDTEAMALINDCWLSETMTEHKWIDNQEYNSAVVLLSTGANIQENIDAVELEQLALNAMTAEVLEEINARLAL